MFKVIRKLTLLSLFATQLALSSVPVSDAVYSEIKTKFYQDEKISLEKIDIFKKALKARANEIKQSVYYYELLHNGESEKKSLKESKKNKYVKTIKMFLKEWVDNIPLDANETEQILYLQKVIDLNNAIKIEITPYLSEAEPLHMIKNLLKRMKFKKYGLEEAKNLLNPTSGEYYTTRELEELKATGFDISTLEPPTDNGTIEYIADISKSDPYKRYRLGKNAMHEHLDVQFPKVNVVYLDEIRKTQSRPKLIVTTKADKGEDLREYKLKMGMEIHSEPTVASLGVTLGLFHDLSKHVKNIKVYIGKMSHDDFNMDFTSYFPLEDLQTIVKRYGKDEGGRFIIFKEGIFEARFDKDDLYRVGPFYPTLKKGLRETRGLQLFNIWVGNIDLKKGENNKTLIRMDNKKMFYSQHDIGFAIGFFAREKPTDFPWEAIKKNKSDEIVFNYRTPFDVEDYKHITMSDSKWMIRKIAQLSREQITTCVKFGKWPNQSPYNYEQLIIEKLISRRNDMVKNFNLLGEMLPNGKTIELMSYNKDIYKEAIPSKNPIGDSTVNFAPALKYDYIIPALRGLGEGIVSAVAGITSGLDDITIPASVFGIQDVNVLTSVILNTDKQIIPNPDAKNMNEKYIVREDFKIGTRLGYGLGIGAEGAFVRSYSLIYPVSDPEKVDKHGKWVFDISMPYRVMKNYLPKKHILISESYIEGRLRYDLEPLVIPVSPGLRTTVDRKYIDRTILGTLDNKKVKIFKDKVTTTGMSSELYVRILIARLKFLSAGFAGGNQTRYSYVLKDNQLDAADDALMNHDYKALESADLIQRTDAEVLARKRELNLLGFLVRSREYAQNDMYIYDFDKEGNLKKRSHELEGDFLKSRQWKLFLNGEQRTKRATMSMEIDKDNKIKDPYIKLKYSLFDNNATAMEIDKHVVPFFNGLAKNSKFINFTAEDHNIHKFYGHINFHMKLKVYKEGIENLLNITGEKWINSLNGVLSLSKRDGNKVTYFGKEYKEARLRRKGSKLFRKLLSAKNKLQKKMKIRKLLEFMVASIPKSKHSEHPILLASILDIIGEENFHMKVEIESPAYQENKMPGRITPYNELGKKRKGTKREKRTLKISDALVLYEQFR
jgi:hypothetical protein